MSRIRVIFFDLDNTLIDFLRMKEEACKAAVQAMIRAGLRMKESDAYEELLKKYFDVGIESNIAFSVFLKSVGQFEHKILAAGLNGYLETKSKCLVPYPNVKPTLSRLKKEGIFLSIVTDAPKTKAYQRLLGMGIEYFFSFVVGYEDTNSLKDTGLPFVLALGLLRKEIPSINEGEILMVGDSVERDIVPAKKFGLKTALSRYGQKTVVPGEPDYELADFKDLLKICITE
jgi:putative hydrolase of the HAD superfamily